ncbi:hypothetical protein Drorol1_Dr00005538 [Drosera rotundifolia]
MADTSDPNSSDTAADADESQFLDADDDFPFFDCPDASSTIAAAEPQLSDSDPIDSIPKPQSYTDTPSSSGLRRRRSSSTIHHNRHISSTSSLDSQITEITQTLDHASLFIRDRKRKINVEDENEEKSEITTAEKETKEEGEVSTSDEGDGSGFLIAISSLLIKAIGFQFNLLFNFITFPIWILYSSYLLLINPIGELRRCKGYVRGLMGRVWGGCVGVMSPWMKKWLKENKSLIGVVGRIGWGMVWSVYVGAVLVGLLGLGFLVGGLVVRSVVEEPWRLERELNFDYTRSSPVALVPITGCKGLGGSGEGVGRVIPSDRKLRATVEMRLPESDYNRKLGMFQVRVEFLASNGKPFASSSHPCMLHFKSNPIRMLLILFKIVPLVAGYVSEAQTLKLNFKGLVVDAVPTACLKVTIEQRAEFRTGAGIPELYSASLLVESELPFLKRILWYWRTTIYVWLSMMVFMAELLLALVCCTPLLLPRVRPQSGALRQVAFAIP